MIKQSNPAVWLGLTLLSACFALSPALRAQQQTRINAALQAGEADTALAELRALPKGGADNAEAQNLACRVHYTLRQWDQAVSACQMAVQLDGGNARYHLWLGRALGEKAGHANFMSAYSLGKQSLAEFETAARLNPRDADALSDLGDFYQQAPGVIGGGADKAERIARQLDSIDPARGHQLRARIAESRNDFGTAEREFKAAIASSAHPALNWTTLASFFRRHKRWQELESAIHNSYSAASRDKHATIALYDGAGVLIESKRNPAMAAKMLETYIGSDSRTEEGPTFEAHIRLAKLKNFLGDHAAAQQERTAALALAHDYRPALEARF